MKESRTHLGGTISDMTDEAEIGKRIKALRLKQKRTLQDLADKTGFTKGYLSKVENTEKAPPVSTLLALARGLGVNVATLFGETVEVAGKISVVRKPDRLQIARDQSVFGYSYEALAHPKLNKRMEPYVLTLPHGGQESPTTFQHSGEEMLYVLQGSIRFHYGSDVYDLSKGDTIYFDAEVPHCGVTIGNEVAECISVIMPE